MWPAILFGLAAGGAAGYFGRQMYQAAQAPASSATPTPAAKPVPLSQAAINAEGAASAAAGASASANAGPPPVNTQAGTVSTTTPPTQAATGTTYQLYQGTTYRMDIPSPGVQAPGYVPINAQIAKLQALGPVTITAQQSDGAGEEVIGFTWNGGPTTLNLAQFQQPNAALPTISGSIPGS